MKNLIEIYLDLDLKNDATFLVDFECIKCNHTNDRFNISHMSGIDVIKCLKCDTYYKINYKKHFNEYGDLIKIKFCFEEIEKKEVFDTLMKKENSSLYTI